MSPAPQVTGVSRKVLLDVDTGCDDAVALAMALAAPDLEVVGITTVAGNTTVDNATHNTLRVLELLDRTDVPVARGAPRPMADALHTAESIHGPDGLRGDLPAPTATPVDDHAVTVLHDLVREYGDDLTIVATGPPTNLGAALVQTPTLGDAVDEVHVMGGAARAAGNATPAAEANFRNDPVAAHRVVTDADPFVAGLDACNHATVPQTLIDDLRGRARPLSQVADWMDYPDFVRTTGPTDEPIVHDAAVVADLIADVLTYEHHPAEVDTSAGPSRGALVADLNRVSEAEPNARIATAVDTERFRATLRETVDRLA